MLRRKSLHTCVFIWLLLAIPLTGFSDEIHINKNRLRLTEESFSNKITLNLNLSQADDFSIKIDQLSKLNQEDTRYFFLHPEDGSMRNMDPVTLGFSLPYNSSDKNAVIRNKSTKANNSYSLCTNHITLGDTSPNSVCKPLFIEVVNDKNAVPGFVYKNTFQIVIIQDGKKELTQQFEVFYKKTGFPIEIHNYKTELSLSKSNSYKDSAPLCVFSRYARAFNSFDVSLEGSPQGSTFLLNHNKISGATFPYHASVSLNKGSPYEALPGIWIYNGKLIQAEDKANCQGKSNLEVTTFAKEQDLRQARPGSYEGTLTVRVRAK